MRTTKKKYGIGGRISPTIRRRSDGDYWNRVWIWKIKLVSFSERIPPRTGTGRLLGLPFLSSPPGGAWIDGFRTVKGIREKVERWDYQKEI